MAAPAPKPTPAPDAAAGPKPLRRDAERNRQLILQAARELFAERGINVSLDDIAAHAGVGVGTVYRRFASRDELVDALFVDRIDSLVESAARAAALDDPWEAVVALITGYLEIQAGDRSFGPVVLTDAHGRGALDSARVRLAPAAAEIVLRAQAAGVIRADLEVTDLPLLIMTTGTLMNAARDVAPEVWRRQLTIVLDGLRPARTGVSPMPAPPASVLDVPEIMHAGFSPGLPRAAGQRPARP